MYCRILSLLLFVLLPVMLAAQAVVVDSVAGTPLPRASVFDRKGNVVGMSDDRGRMPYVSPDTYPLTVRYMGYETALVPHPGDLLIKLRESVSELPEVVVTSDKRQVLRLTGYVREYSSLSTYTDTILLFREKTVDFMLPLVKARKFDGRPYQRVLASKSYYRFTDCWGLDSVSDHFGYYFSWSDWIGLIDHIDLPEKLRGREEATDTVYGRYSPAALWRRKNGDVYIDIDVLADTTGHVPVLGLSSFTRGGDMDFAQFTMKYTFTNADDTCVKAEDISRIAMNIETDARGRSMSRLSRIDEPLAVNTYAEIYITDIEYMTVADARRLDKSAPRSEDAGINPPADAPPLQPAIKEMIERVERVKHSDRRLANRPDDRLGSTVHDRKRPHRWRQMLKSILR